MQNNKKNIYLCFFIGGYLRLLRIKIVFSAPLRLCGRISCVFTALALAGCHSSGVFLIPPPLPDDRRPIPMPAEQEYNLVEEAYEMQFQHQVEQLIDIPRNLRLVSNQRKQAFNTDAFDEVPNSSWFTNRNHRQPLLPEEIRRGPDSGPGPDTQQPWTIFRAKSEGVTPGFSIQDSRGDRYVIKFDPPGYPELSSGAEVVTTKILHALGFFVPENYITVFDPAILRISPDVRYTDEHGRRRSLNEEDLKILLSHVERLPDGRIRALASRYIPGRPVGPFLYHGTREDDPNDIVPHQYRRELRGLRYICAWLNHFDTKAGNTFDTYIGEDGSGHIRHYLMDFGSTLGSAAHGPTPPRTGHENYFDPKSLLLNTVTLGLYVREYERMDPEPVYPSIGNFSSRYFHPKKYKFIVPNPAFEEATNRDGFWAARLITSLTDVQLEAAVACGRYSNVEAAAALLQALIERRDIIGRYFFGQCNAFDQFRLTHDQEQTLLTFTDLAVALGYAMPGITAYRYEIRCNGRVVASHQKIDFCGAVMLPDPGGETGGQWEITLQIRRSPDGRWGRWVKVYVEHGQNNTEPRIIGLRRQEW